MNNRPYLSCKTVQHVSDSVHSHPSVCVSVSERVRWYVCVCEIKRRGYDETERCEKEKKKDPSTRWTELPVKAVTQLSVEMHSTIQTFLKAIKMSEFLISLQSVHPCSGCEIQMFQVETKSTGENFKKCEKSFFYRYSHELIRS